MPLNVSNPIVFEDGTMQAPFREFMNEVSRWIPIQGEGSPEGSVPAPLYSLYIDKNGAAGAIEYRKMSSDIAGDKTKGWLAV